MPSRNDFPMRSARSNHAREFMAPGYGYGNLTTVKSRRGGLTRPTRGSPNSWGSFRGKMTAGLKACLSFGPHSDHQYQRAFRRAACLNFDNSAAS